MIDQQFTSRYKMFREQVDFSTITRNGFKIFNSHMTGMPDLYKNFISYSNCNFPVNKLVDKDYWLAQYV